MPFRTRPARPARCFAAARLHQTVLRLLIPPLPGGGPPQRYRFDFSFFFRRRCFHFISFFFFFLRVVFVFVRLGSRLGELVDKTHIQNKTFALMDKAEFEYMVFLGVGEKPKKKKSLDIREANQDGRYLLLS